ncbi:MAG: phosphatidylserine decarboxylase [Acidobacteriota bacterium]
MDRQTGAVVDEQFFGDNIVRFLYGPARERAPWLLRMLTSARFSRWLAALNFDLPLAPRLIGNLRFLQRCGVDPAECLIPPALLNTPRAIFERQLRYWECRPMSEDQSVIVSPCDARVLTGSQQAASGVCLKGKLFAWDELVGRQQTRWHSAFAGGEAAVFRLTPDRYHWNHTPVAGVVEAIYELDGSYHSCHPMALIAEATPLSKNRRTVTIINTDVGGGTRVGLVAMVEVVALMIGDVVQRYCSERYADPRDLIQGMFVKKGVPEKSVPPR